LETIQTIQSLHVVGTEFSVFVLLVVFKINLTAVLLNLKLVFLAQCVGLLYMIYKICC